LGSQIKAGGCCGTSLCGGWLGLGQHIGGRVAITAQQQTAKKYKETRKDSRNYVLHVFAPEWSYIVS